MAKDLTAAEMNETVQANLIAMCSVIISLSILALGLRFWSNYVAPSYRWWWDDFFAAITLPFAISENAIILWWISLGLGKHAATIPPADQAKSPMIIFIANLLYYTNISLPKFSALFFYGRIFQQTNKWFTLALWAIGVMNAGWLLSTWVVSIFGCTPINGAWEKVPGRICIPQWNWLLGAAIPSMVIDLLILTLPLPMLWGLQVTAIRRIMVVVAFLFGYSVIVLSIGRLVTLARVGTSLFDDLTWTSIEYSVWVQCEGLVSLVSVCLPSIIRLAKHVFRNGRRESLSNSRASSEMLYSSTKSLQKAIHSHGGLSGTDVYPRSHSQRSHL
ncbi:hypothetical protein F4824DRAFT_517121 [Ustulina deusta]|nr:hypothetical protein F4824DRAFT_517121 [Ustulina deusta]